MSAVTERASTFARDMLADVARDYQTPFTASDRSRFTMATLIGMVDAAANQTDIIRSDADRLAEIRAYLTEYRAQEAQR